MPSTQQKNKSFDVVDWKKKIIVEKCTNIKYTCSFQGQINQFVTLLSSELSWSCTFKTERQVDS